MRVTFRTGNAENTVVLLWFFLPPLKIVLILYPDAALASGVASEFPEQHKGNPETGVQAFCEHVHKTMALGSLSL